jgi:hypothetical protein
LLFESFFCSEVFPSQSTIPDHLLTLKEALESRDVGTYLSLCAPQIREEENSALKSYFEDSNLEKVLVFYAGESQDKNGLNRAFFQVLFQSRYSALIEVWQISYERSPGGILIHKRKVSGSLRNLYRLSFPGQGSVSARNIQLIQKDLRVSFTEGQIFFDNLPEVDTAVIIVGRGQVHFEPSDGIERNQLIRRYKKPYFEETLESVYVRGSENYFKNNLSYSPAKLPELSLRPEAAKNQVYSIFVRSYARSFTVENSLTGELLTFLPQSDETVVEIKTANKGEFTYVYSPFAEEEISFFDRTRNRLINSYSPQEEGQKRLYIRFGQQFEINNYQLEVNYRPENHLMAASAELLLTSLTETLNSCQLRLNPDLEILKIEDSQGRELFYSRDRLRRYLYVYLVERIPRDESFWLRIFYRGKIVPPPPQSDVSFQQAIEDRRILVPVSDSFLFAQSSEWYPAPVREKYVAFKLRIIVPDGYYCLAGGRLLEQYSVKDAETITELANLGSSIYVYESQVPVKYISFFIARLNPEKAIENGIVIKHFTTQDWRYPEKRVLAEAHDILNKFQQFFGPYPYQELVVVQRHWHTYGGHASPGLVILDSLPVSRGPEIINATLRSPVDLSFWPEYYLAHEIAHQWWGHGITWTSYRDNWLTEGLAQFSTIMYLKEKYGLKDFQQILKRIAKPVRKKSSLGPIILGIRLSHMDFYGYQSIIYNKAALVLLMLKDWLGEEVFFRSLQEFYQDFRFKAVGTSDFRRTMERVSGQDLSQFFRDWFYSERLPDVRINKKILQTDSTSKLELTVRQLQKPMVIPLTVVLETDSLKTQHLLLIDSAVQTFELKFSGRFKRIVINPGDRVPGKFK